MACPENAVAHLDDLAIHHPYANEAKTPQMLDPVPKFTPQCPPGVSTNRSMLKISNASCLKTPPKPAHAPKFAVIVNKPG